MSNWKKIGTGLGAVVVLGAVVAGTWAYKSLNTSRSAVADDTVKLADFQSDDAQAVKRGEYVMRLADCAACHTRDQGEFAGGYKIVTDFGTLVSSNITPDRKTGIGDMTEKEFFNAVRQGIGKNGFLYPAMPYPAYAKLTDQDMHDLWAYMSTVKPVAHEVDENGGMKFPFNIRLAMAGWNMLFFNNKGFTADDAQSSAWNRGKYIVDGSGHCSTCHSPRNKLGGEVDSAYLQGGNIGAWYAPDLTQNPHVGLGGTSVGDIVSYLKTGTDGVAIASGPMAEAVEHSLRYLTDEDATAIATYLTSLPASKAEGHASLPLDTPEMKRAALDYEVNCSACHGVKGEGIKGMVPTFAGNTAMLDDPTNMIHLMLKGGRAPFAAGAQTGAGMPSFAWKLSDARMAELLTYLRNAWGNGAPAVSAEQVGTMRAQLQARTPLNAKQ